MTTLMAIEESQEIVWHIKPHDTQLYVNAGNEST